VVAEPRTISGLLFVRSPNGAAVSPRALLESSDDTGHSVPLPRQIADLTDSSVNYATALLLAGEIRGCLGVLAGINDDQNPSVVRLRVAVKNWKRSLGFVTRLRWVFGETIDDPVPFDGVPGEF
jgi:hypothetical protein